MAGQARYLDPAIVARLGTIDLKAKTIVEGFLTGLHRSPFKGFSVEFAEYRQYLPGDDLATLDDGQPFVLFWAPDSRSFYVNHQVAGGTERLHYFTIHKGSLVQSRALDDSASALVQARRDCLTPRDVAISGIRWGRDGRRVALLAYARRAACNGMGNWRPLWMIGDAATGRIDPGSVRGRSGRAPLPADGPYATL